MFSFFKKRTIEVEVELFDASRFAAGLAAVTTKRSYKSDVRALQKRFYGVRDQAKDRSNPSGTLVIFRNPDGQGRFTYFVGDLVDSERQPEALTVVELPPGPYADIHVKFKTPEGLSLSVARAKQYFMEKWLPSSGYTIRDGVESMELYDRRSSIGLPSIELIFPLQAERAEQE